MHKRLHSVSLPEEVTAGKWPLLLELWATEVCPKGPELSHRQGYRRSGDLVCWDLLLPSVAHLCKLYPNLVLLRGSWGGFPTGNRNYSVTVPSFTLSIPGRTQWTTTAKTWSQIHRKKVEFHKCTAIRACSRQQVYKVTGGGDLGNLSIQDHCVFSRRTHFTMK